MAVAIMMKHSDLAVGEAVYTDTPLYAYLSEWVDGMRAPGGSYFECKDIATGRRYGQSSPAHYTPSGGSSAPACRSPDRVRTGL